MEILNKLKKTIFFTLVVIYEEILFALFVFKQIPSTIAIIILFSIPVGILFNVITECFKERGNKIASYIIIIAIGILFSAHFVYNQIYQSIISIYSFANGKQVFQFYETILDVIKNNFWKIFLMLLPIVVLILLHKFKKLNFVKTSIKKKVIQILSLAIIQVITVLIITLGPSDRNKFN